MYYQTLFDALALDPNKIGFKPENREVWKEFERLKKLIK
jgi:hypothetical protein